MSLPVIVAGDVQDGVWCPPCNAATRIRVPLHNRGRHGPVIANLEVCVSCGMSFLPSVPVVTVTRPGWQRPRPVLAFEWWLHRRASARAGRPAVACAVQACRKPGWWDCCWYEAVDDGRVRWMFCGGKHRRAWLARNRMPELLTI